MEHAKEIQNSSKACKVLWYLLNRQAGAAPGSLTKAAVRKCQLTEALQAIRLKDTIPLPIWSVVLQGAGLILSLQMGVLAEDVLYALRNCFLLPKRLSKEATGVSKDTVSFFPLPCSLTLCDYPLPTCSAGLKTGQVISLDTTQEAAPPTEEVFGQQDDFQSVLAGNCIGEKATSAVQTPKLEGTSMPVTPVLFRFRTGNETTVARKKKLQTDRVCCVTEAYLRAWALQTEGITKLHRQAPPRNHPILTSTLMEALEVYRRGMDTTGFFTVAGKMAVREEYFVEAEHDAPAPSQPYDLDPSSPHTPTSDLRFPSSTEFSFHHTLKLNPTLHPASVFLRVLQFVRIGQIELQQEAAFGPLLIQRIC